MLVALNLIGKRVVMKNIEGVSITSAGTINAVPIDSIS